MSMNEQPDAPDLSPPADTAGPAAPARRRRSAAARPAADAAPAPEAAADAVAASPAPRRRSRAAAPVAAEAVADALPAEPTPSPVQDAAAAEAAEAAEVAEPKAPRRRSPRKPAAAAVAQTDSEVAPDAPPAPRTEAGWPAESPAASAAPQADATDATDTVSAPADEDAAPDAGSAPRPGRPTAVPPPVESLVAARALFDALITGHYDPEAETAAQAAAAGDSPDDAGDDEGPADAGKRVLEAEPDAPKLHKVLAQSGVGSRRDMEQLIADGQVTVNGEVAHLGMRVVIGDRVEVKGKPVRLRIHPPTARVLAYHKPTGEVVTHSDPEGRPTVFRHLPRLPQGKWLSVGRLDINTEGLLLFTNSGDLANRLMHPRFGVEREYAVRVLGQLGELQRAQLLAGVAIDGQTAAFRSIDNGGGEGANHWYRVVISEGRNREVRKLFESVGLVVSRLIRIRYGSVVLPRGLKRGVWVELDEPDLKVIRQLAGLHDGPRPQPAVKTGKAARGPKPMQNGPRPQPGEQQARGPAGGGKPGKPGGNKFGPGGKGPRPAGGPQGGAARPPRPERPPREVLRDADGEALFEDVGRIPNPLEQTFDRRFAKGGPRRPAQGFGGAQRIDDDYVPGGAIPNPLEQTFDRRFVKGSQRIVAGFGRPDSGEQGGAPGGPKGPKGGPKQPDPMQTSVGYIGADAYFNKGGKKGGGGGGGGNWGGKRRGR